MAEGEKTSKIKDVKETVFGAIEIMRQIGRPGMQESFGSFINTAKIAKEIIESLKTAEMVKNIDNFRLISENMREASDKMEKTLKQLQDTGVVNEAVDLVKSAKNTFDSFSDSGQDLHEMSVTVKEVFRSVRALVDELRMATVS
jgi:methyl-accepting chemotaxis protein